MKLIIAVLALVGAQAFACPNLTGTFSCTSDGQTQAVAISQVEVNGVTTYTLKNPADPADQGGSLPADNNTYQIQDSEDFKNGTIRGWCEADAFKIEQTGQYYDQGQHIGDVQATIAMSLVDNNLSQVTTGTFKTGSGDYPINQTMSCVRN